METLVQADIFFFITSAAVLVVSIATLIALYFFIQILRDVRYTAKRVREETDLIISDVEDLRQFLKKEGEKTTHIGSIIAGLVGKFVRKRKSSGRRNKKGEHS